jgi:hypothetical protein
LASVADVLVEQLLLKTSFFFVIGIGRLKGNHPGCCRAGWFQIRLQLNSNSDLAFVTATMDGNRFASGP